MTDRTQYIASLIVKRLKDDLTAEESRELEEWSNLSLHRKQVFEELQDPEAAAKIIASWSHYDNSTIEQKLEAEFPEVFRLVQKLHQTNLCTASIF